MKLNSITFLLKNKIKLEYLTSTLVLLGSLFLLMISSGLIHVICAILFVLSIRSDYWFVVTMMIYLILRYLNSDFIFIPFGVVGWYWVLIFVKTFLMFFKLNVFKSKIFFPITLFTLYAILVSLFLSNYFFISLMKLLSFYFGAVTLYAIVEKLGYIQITKLLITVLSYFSLMSLLSAYTLTNPGVAYSLNGIGFQGIINHPQTLGPLLAAFCSFFIGMLIFNKVNLKWFIGILVVITTLIILIMMTKARTALASIALSVMFSSILYLTSSRFRKIDATKTIFIGKSLLFSFGLIILLFTSSSLKDSVNQFVFKRDSGNVEEALSSRSKGYQFMWNQFLRSPLVGHGFGVYSAGDHTKDVVYLWGIPISAPVEKGLLPLAILEELGLIGFILFIYLTVSLYASVKKTYSYSLVTLFFSCLFVNIGEAVFFAVGGIGMFYWIVICIVSQSFKVKMLNKTK